MDREPETFEDLWLMRETSSVWFDGQLRYEDKVYGTVIAFDSADIRSLADLIDPTCGMEAAGGVPAPVKDSLETFFCSECGSPIYNDVNPSYCLYCGHRVVDRR